MVAVGPLRNAIVVVQATKRDQVRAGNSRANVRFDSCKYFRKLAIPAESGPSPCLRLARAEFRAQQSRAKRKEGLKPQLKSTQRKSDNSTGSICCTPSSHIETRQSTKQSHKRLKRFRRNRTSRLLARKQAVPYCSL